ncbi:hypothetical protein K435DRAFT_692657, partial [Dendrothele bispora CBS 962.96]
MLSTCPQKSRLEFPPQPAKEELIHKIIKDWTDSFDSKNIEEIGCAVCGQLRPFSEVVPLKSMKNYLNVLVEPSVTCKEPKSSSDSTNEDSSPVLDQTCDQVCLTCRKSLREGKRPRISLANGLWLGSIPEELKELNFMERLLIQKIRTNCCFVKVSSGMRKMISHVIAFETPVVKVYDT